jgi:hypothetical protein
MATDDELRELSERIVRLGTHEQMRLLEMVLADARAARAREDELGRQELKAWEEWHLRHQRPAVSVEEHAREAG